MLTVRVGYVVIPAAATLDDHHGPASKRSRVEHTELSAEGVSSEVHVTSLDDLTELQTALGCFFERGRASAGPLSSLPAVEVRRLPCQTAGGDMLAFCVVPGVLDVVLAAPAVDRPARLAAVVHALPDEQRALLHEAMTAEAAFPRCIRVGATASDGVACAVVPETVLCVPAPSAATKVEASPFAKPILVVGAGGIGCELLKVLVLRGFTHIHLVDLDTIDATNLNRQFLFTSADVGHSKAETACAAVLRWFTAANAHAHTSDKRPTPMLVPHHDNIKSATYDVTFYAQFSAVLNALDNVSARQHVNRLCVRANVPLIESGTMGYNGQVQPILPGLCECYDCRPKPADQKTFAVCTIHARPTTMVHCVHYAKELYATLFTPAESTAVSDRPHDAQTSASHELSQPDPRPQVTSGEGELQYLQDMACHWRQEVSAAADQPRDEADPRTAVLAPLLGFGEQLAACLFVTKVTELLAMKSSWSTAPPVPLSAAAIRTAVDTASFDSLAALQRLGAHLTESPATPRVDEDVQLFVAATALCAARLFCHGEATAFRKEDDTAVQFVAAAANLRARVFHIETQSVESLRTIAGAIVPAIATTNAMAGAGVVQQLERVLAGRAHTSGSPLPEGVQMIYIRRTPQTRRRQLRSSSCLSGSCARTHHRAEGPVHAVKDQYLVHAVAPSAPVPDCKICQRLVPSIVMTLNLRQHTLADLATDLLENLAGLESVCISQAASILYEEDFESLGGRLLSSFLPSTGLHDEPEPAALPSLLLVVDALNREMEWELELRHTTDSSAGVTVDGVDAAKATEAQALLKRDGAVVVGVAAAAREADEAGALGSGAGATVHDALVLESGSEDDVLEVQTSVVDPAATLDSTDSAVIEID